MYLNIKVNIIVIKMTTKNKVKLLYSVSDMSIRDAFKFAEVKGKK